MVLVRHTGLAAGELNDSQRDSSVAEYLPHKQVAGGSSPPPASNMIEAFAFYWYLMLPGASGNPPVITGGIVQTEDGEECEAARRDKVLELSGGRMSESGSGWLVGSCRKE